MKCKIFIRELITPEVHTEKIINDWLSRVGDIEIINTEQSIWRFSRDTSKPIMKFMLTIFYK